MEMTAMVLGLVVVTLLGVWLAVRSKRWKTLLTASGPDSGELHAKYEHLKLNKVKCKLVSDSSTVGVVQSADFPSGERSVIKLKVHEKHIEQAKELLEEFPEAV